MSRYGRDPDEIRLEISDAVGRGEDVVEHFQQLTRARGWRDGS